MNKENARKLAECLTRISKLLEVRKSISNGYLDIALDLEKDYDSKIFEAYVRLEKEIFRCILEEAIHLNELD